MDKKDQIIENLYNDMDRLLGELKYLRKLQCIHNQEKKIEIYLHGSSCSLCEKKRMILIFGKIFTTTHGFKVNPGGLCIPCFLKSLVKLDI